jgi:hypothetical protein
VPERRAAGSRLLRAVAIAVPVGVALGVGFAILRYFVAPPAQDWRGDLAALDDGPAFSLTGDRFSITDSMRTFRESVWIDHQMEGGAVDRTVVECHGGRAQVTWHIGNLEPVTRDSGIHLTVRMDGAPVASILRGSAVDTWGDAPLTIHAVVDCSSGQHVIDLHVSNVDGAWGFPFVVNRGDPLSPLSRIGRGFIIREVWNSAPASPS